MDPFPSDVGVTGIWDPRKNTRNRKHDEASSACLGRVLGPMDFRVPVRHYFRRDKGGLVRGLVKGVVAFFLIAAVTLSTTSAGAVDDRFWGRYVARWSSNDPSCGDYRVGVRIRYVNARTRQYDPAGANPGWRLNYHGGTALPWQFNGTGQGMTLRYQPAIDGAVGYAYGQGCRWTVSLSFAG